ncbi:DUF4307 domain-containing protein [Streptomyces sp. URMC 123]|uniref:DUF4307 domain-containing protein n=1 Tax=Streptomyces sp. URMC 123 TaxID=3423403 RepID=UPI003F1CB331
MTATREALPEGRYGRSADARADHKLKIIGAVLGVGLLGLVAWSGYAYVSEQQVSAELIKFEIVSDQAVQAHLEIHKDAGVSGVCKLRSLDEDKAVVGLADFRFEERESRVDKVVTVRTTRRATTVQVLGCEAAGTG